MWDWLWFRTSPGPCPVCDAPHCTCVSADYDPSKYSSPGFPATAPPSSAPPQAPPAGEFSTVTYRRRVKK